MLTERAKKTLASVAERSMVDEIEVWRPQDSELDDDLVQRPIPQTAEAMVYEGKARITSSRGPREQPVGEGVMVMRDADAIIPKDSPLVYRDDEVYVVSSEDPALDGRWFKVTDVRVFSEQAARRFSVVQTQPSRQWHPPEEGEE